MPDPKKPKSDAPKSETPKPEAKEEHSAQSDVARKLYEKLHNAKHAEHPTGGPPNKPKGGGHQPFNKHAGPKSGPPRRTQGKGG